ncbi:MAG: amylo-alpha-1,6-glucosidase, partial [Bacteroidota bacterium]
DAIQSYLMNYYLFFDTEVNKRTMIALRGKDPIKTHINTILDYSLYWLISFKDYYEYTGDASFLVEMYPKMKTMMDFILERRNEKGFLQGLPGDWVFIDWADISKEGEISFEQILFEQSLAAMQLSAKLAGESEDQKLYDKLGKELKSSIESVFWDPEKEQVLYRRVNDTLSDEVSRHANIFSILGNYFDDKKREKIKENILLNPEITALRTPYMKFYELAALCETGEHEFVIRDILNYWGGMLDLGATSFWEEYNPEKSGLEHYSMYGFPFNKSLCHSWGASPIYLFGKYFLGVKPLAPGYSEYEVQPNLGGLDFIQGIVPTAKGNVQVFMDAKTIEVTSEIENGILRFESTKPPKCKQGVIKRNSSNEYEIELKANVKYKVTGSW